MEPGKEIMLSLNTIAAMRLCYVSYTLLLFPRRASGLKNGVPRNLPKTEFRQTHQEIDQDRRPDRSYEW